MSENKLVEAVRELSDDQLAEIAGGGECTATQIQDAINNAKQSYDTLVEFATYVIERVAGS